MWLVLQKEITEGHPSGSLFLLHHHVLFFADCYLLLWLSPIITSPVLPLAFTSLPPSSNQTSLLCLKLSYPSVHQALSSAFFAMLGPSLNMAYSFVSSLSSILKSNCFNLHPHTDTSVFQEDDQRRRT